ncbi:protein of unknown function DUF1830 [Stanieria cyanosphaera PCC 7437]|uniref:DUF1830 domain-containing protein n=1 Tax=Stanieria cyanosphaera (strain ATCC 29371 / PCC 7437) TaxID=111780 RepID=K9XRG7_STAC7|nr:DUF1830 domain-containing protein [Stanieria cyanosphaera]AFZ35210.1 protein of unknown function DUF1830 [Stanieria cyanosphaera PCC 7437]
MSQILDPVPNNEKNTILCCYVNATSQIQVARITNIPNWYFERVVFPGQRLVFEAVRDALLEIHTGMMASAILSDTIPCERLCINEGQDSESEKPTQTESKTTENSTKNDRVNNNHQPTTNQFKTTVSVV